MALCAFTSVILSIITFAAISDVTSAQDEIIELIYELLEEQASGTYVGNIVRDANLTSLYGANVIDAGKIRFRFMRQPHPVEFVVDPISGEVLTGRGRVDRESICPPRTVTCVVRTDIVVHPVEYFRIIRLTVVIADLNDGTPRFPDSSPVTIDVLESATIGSVFSLPIATDPDSPQFSVTSYRLVTSSDDAGDVRRQFKLAEDRVRDGSLVPRLVLVGTLDRERVDRYQLTLVAVDGGRPSPRTASIDVAICVLDANDNRPVFERDEYDVAIPENSPTRTSVVRVRAVDNDIGLNGHVTYSLSESTGSEIFDIDSATGDVYLVGSVDGDGKTSSFQLFVVAKDSGLETLESSAVINVEITDVNDNAPEVTSIDSLVASSMQSEADAVVLENGKPGTFVAHLTIVDLDSGNNGQFNCSLRPFDDSDKFQLKRVYETEFQMLTSSPLDRESSDLYNVTIECMDFGAPPLTLRRSMRISVGDVNDHVPAFERSRYVCELFENNYLGAFVVQTSASDDDLGNNSRLTYSLSGAGSELFAVDSTSGLITAVASLDREVTPKVSFRVVVADAGNPSLVGSALVVVSVQDVNDNRPRFDGSVTGLSFAVAENQPAGTVVGQVSATDLDSGPNQSIEYRLLIGVSGDGGDGSNVWNGAVFYIDPETGILMTGVSLDRELVDKYVINVVAVDRGMPPLSSTATVVINVLDVNDNAPEFQFPSPNDGKDTVSVSTSVRPGTVIAQLVALDADAGLNSQIAYGFDDSSIPFHVDSETGQLIVDGDLSQSDGAQFNLFVTASDYRGLSTSAVLHVVVNASLVAAALEPNSDERTFAGLFISRAFGSGVRLIAVTCVVVVSAIVTILLLIAIAVVRRRQTRDCARNGKPRYRGSSRQYNCRTAACERLNQVVSTSGTTLYAAPSRQSGVDSPITRTVLTFTNSFAGSSGEDTHGSGSSVGYGVVRPATSTCCCCCAASTGSGDCDRCGGSQQRLLQSCTAALLLNTDQTGKTQVSSSKLRSTFSNQPVHSFHTIHQFPSERSATAAAAPTTGQQTELEVRHLLRRLQVVPDTDDATSDEHSNGDGSHTDSGRGASDDGDNAAASGGVNARHRQEIRSTDDRCQPISSKTLVNGRFPRDQRCSRDQIYNRDVLAGSRPLPVAHAQHACDVIVDDEDAETTTSGSYVVDPRELCNEIDQIFFAGGV